MSLVIIDDFAAKRKSPTSVTETMSLKNNYYIVKHDERYHYYRITVAPYKPEDQIIRFDKFPPVIREGIVILEKKCYKVTLPDLLRGVIRKSREIVKEKNGTKSIAATAVELDKSNGASTVLISSIKPTVQHSDEPAIIEEAEHEILQQADVCWNEQIESLLNTFDKEEGGWQISDIIQPRPDDEVSAVQNPQGNP